MESEKQDQASKLKAAQEQLQEQIQQNAEAVEKLKEANDDIEKVAKEKDDFSSKLNAIQDEKEGLLENKNTKDDMLHRMEAELSNMKIKNANLERDYQDARQHNSEWEKEIIDLN